jgi:hypothetical protein
MRNSQQKAVRTWRRLLCMINTCIPEVARGFSLHKTLCLHGAYSHVLDTASLQINPNQTNASPPPKKTFLYAPTALPPSTSKLTPVMNFPSSLARYKHKFATSFGSVNLPNGTFPRNFFTFSGVCSTPTNVLKRPVPDRRGQSAFTRIWSLPYSAARPFVACTILALLPGLLSVSHVRSQPRL